MRASLSPREKYIVFHKYVFTANNLLLFIVFTIRLFTGFQSYGRLKYRLIFKVILSSYQIILSLRVIIYILKAAYNP